MGIGPALNKHSTVRVWGDASDHAATRIFSGPDRMAGHETPILASMSRYCMYNTSCLSTSVACCWSESAAAALLLSAMLKWQINNMNASIANADTANSPMMVAAGRHLLHTNGLLSP
eukprot:GHRR01015433.1.p2 GENE.GHRR01015433.1~~GHRR01015433.1.p2  ORF type:complete len:117 (-),score=35.10 GHRR01015433.1:133-483(-)